MLFWPKVQFYRKNVPCTGRKFEFAPKLPQPTVYFYPGQVDLTTYYHLQKTPGRYHLPSWHSGYPNSVSPTKNTNSRSKIQICAKTTVAVRIPFLLPPTYGTRNRTGSKRPQVVMSYPRAAVNITNAMWPGIWNLPTCHRNRILGLKVHWNAKIGK